MAKYDKSQLINKGKIRRIVIEYEDIGEPLVVLDREEADEFIADWNMSLPDRKRVPLPDKTPS